MNTKNAMQRYFDNQSEEANNTFLNAGGFDDAQGFDEDEYSYADDEYFAESGEIMAEGGGSNAQSIPYIVILQNTTGSTIQNVPLFGAYNALPQVANNWGMGTGVVLSMGTPNVAYNQLLYQSMEKPFEVGYVYIQCSAMNQLLDIVTIRTQDANGKLLNVPYPPAISPYQYQTQLVLINYSFLVDGFTSFIITNLYASSTVMYRFYPKSKIDPKKRLVTGTNQTGYTNPGIIQSQPMTIKQAAPHKKHHTRPV